MENSNNESIFRIKNYKSIKNSGVCSLEEITILAGKNESGKTAILEALEDFNIDKKIRKDAIPIWSESLKPEISIFLRVERNELDEFLNKINATYFKTDRGGDITYHGLGQLVGYPIINLEKYGLRVRSYIEKMEDVIIKTIADYGIKSSRLENATGVWLDVGIAGEERKIAAIGVKVSRLVSMHGFALNINTDLSYFNHINPCGFVDKGVTSMQNELGYEIDFEEVKEKLKENFLLFLKQ